MPDVSREKWFKTFVANNETALKNFFRQGAAYIKIVGIKPDTQNKATEEEWSYLERALEQGIREGRVAGVPTDAKERYEFSRIPISRLKHTLKEAAGNTYIIVASCAAQYFDEVTEMIGKKKNVAITFGSKHDIANNLSRQWNGKGGAAQAPQKTSHYDALYLATKSVLCPYNSETHGPCSQKVADGKLFCRLHACPRPGCDNRKSSDSETCDVHAAKGATTTINPTVNERYRLAFKIA